MSPPSSAEATDAHTVPREVRSSPLHERHVHIHARLSPDNERESGNIRLCPHTKQRIVWWISCVLRAVWLCLFVCVFVSVCMCCLFACGVCICVCGVCICVFFCVVCLSCVYFVFFVYLCVCACPCVVILFCLYLFSRVYLFTCAYICLHLRVLYPQDIVYRKVVQNLYYKHNSNLFSFSVCQGPIACLRHGIICLRSQNVTE